MFELRPALGFAGGLTMQLGAGALPSDHKTLRSLVMREAVFGFLEAPIVAHWPEFAPYGRFGVTEIPAPAWAEILRAIERTANDIEFGPEGVFPAYGGFDAKELKRRFVRNPDQFRAELCRFLREIISATRPWIDSHDCVTIYGI